MSNQYQEKILLCATRCAVTACAKETTYQIINNFRIKILVSAQTTGCGWFPVHWICYSKTLHAQCSNFTTKKDPERFIDDGIDKWRNFRYRRNFINRRWISMLTWTVYFSTSRIDSMPGYYNVLVWKKGEKLTHTQKREPTSSQFTVNDVRSPAQPPNRLCYQRKVISGGFFYEYNTCIVFTNGGWCDASLISLSRKTKGF